jgi:hypothetical protein
MEVHHHHRRSNKPRKKKEYLFDFLIIFVAITGSFFAENLREHFVDRHKEKVYMVSMLQDLKSDSTSLGIIIQQNNEQIKGLDSLLDVIKNNIVGKSIKQFYHLDLKYSLDYTGFNPVNRTIKQLMNTGGLGLIKVKAVSDGIVGYDNALNAVLTHGELLGSQFARTINMQSEIIDFLALKKIQLGSSVFELKKYPALLSANKKTINSYYFNITIFKGAITGYTKRLEALKEQATSLCKLIQKEYNL